MPERHPDLLLAVICEAIERIARYTNSLDFGAFLADDKTIDAVVRNLEIIGEAALLAKPPSVSRKGTRKQHLRFHGIKSRASAIASFMTTSGWIYILFGRSFRWMCQN